MRPLRVTKFTPKGHLQGVLKGQKKNYLLTNLRRFENGKIKKVEEIFGGFGI